MIVRIPKDRSLYFKDSDFIKLDRYQASARKANTEAGWY